MDNIKKGGNKLEKKAEKAQKEADTTGLEAVDLRGDNKGILTWAEVVNGKIARPSIELLTPARHLADQLGGDTKITTVLIGKNVRPLAPTLFEHGSDKVIIVENDKLEEYLILPFAEIITQIIHQYKPEITLFAATTAGRELAPRIGMKTGSGVTADCTGLEIGDYIDKKNKRIIRPILHSRRPTYGESKLATILGFNFKVKAIRNFLEEGAPRQGLRLLQRTGNGLPLPRRRGPEPRHGGVRRSGQGGGQPSDGGALHAHDGHPYVPQSAKHYEIGRASCRERV